MNFISVLFAVQLAALLYLFFRKLRNVMTGFKEDYMNSILGLVFGVVFFGAGMITAIAAVSGDFTDELVIYTVLLQAESMFMILIMVFFAVETFHWIAGNVKRPVTAWKVTR